VQSSREKRSEGLKKGEKDQPKEKSKTGIVKRPSGNDGIGVVDFAPKRIERGRGRDRQREKKSHHKNRKYGYGGGRKKKADESARKRVSTERHGHQALGNRSGKKSLQGRKKVLEGRNRPEVLHMERREN